VLRRRGIQAVHFLPTLVPWRAPYFNLRNHRKILVVDGRVGFTGGMNIRHSHRLEAQQAGSVADVHFELRGPTVRQLQEVFAEDWAFSTREALAEEDWFPPLEPVGEMAVRAVADGPDQDLEKIRWTLLGGIACAERRIKIQTPYFLPLRHLSTALQIAARRGVEVDLLLPQQSNLLLVHWASRSMWQEVLEAGCRVWLVPKPFDHSKLMIMDDQWSFVGSSNWDPRSLRLNFELNLECWSSELNAAIAEIFEDKKRRAYLLTPEEHERRGYGVRILDGATRLLSPYL
jgi:cardiolipin synthase